MRPASRGKQAPPTIDPGPRPRQLPRGEPCGMHAHDDVVLGGVRVRQVREGQPSQTSVAVTDDDGSHGILRGH